MLRTVVHPHIGPVLIPIKYTISAGAGVVVDSGPGDFPATSRGAAGLGSLTFNKGLVPTATAPIFCASAATSVANGAYVVRDIGSTGITVSATTVNAAGTGTDGVQYAAILGYTNDSTDSVSPAQQVLSTARSPRIMGFRITNAGAVAVGASQATCTVASAVYTITYTNAFARAPVVLATPINATQVSANVTTSTASGCTISTFNISEAAAAQGFYLTVIGWDSTDQQWNMRRALQCPQLKPRLLAFRILDTAGTPSLVVGQNDGTVADNGTGHYAITFNKPFAREPIALTPTADTGRAFIRTANTTTTCTVQCTNAAGTTTDDTVDVMILGYDSPTEI